MKSLAMLFHGTLKKSLTPHNFCFLLRKVLDFPLGLRLIVADGKLKRRATCNISLKGRQDKEILEEERKNYRKNGELVQRKRGRTQEEEKKRASIKLVKRMVRKKGKMEGLNEGPKNGR